MDLQFVGPILISTTKSSSLSLWSFVHSPTTCIIPVALCLEATKALNEVKVRELGLEGVWEDSLTKVEMAEQNGMWS